MIENGTTSDQIVQTTAAKRLRSVFTALKSANVQSLSQALPVILQVTEESKVTDFHVLQAVQLMSVLIQDFLKELQEARLPDEQVKMCQRCIYGLCRAISPANLVAPVQNGRLQVTDIDLDRLEFVDALLNSSVAEQRLTTDTLEDLAEAVLRALRLLESAHLPNEIKDLLATQLLNVRQAIDQYRFRGIRGVQEALAGYRGMLGVTKTEVEATLDEESKTTLKDVLDRGQQAVALAHNFQSLWPKLVEGAHHVKGFLENL